MNRADRPLGFALAAATAFALVLCGCGGVRHLPRLDPSAAPSADEWEPHEARLEWWYVSAFDETRQRAFHFAVFKSWPPPEFIALGVPYEALAPFPLVIAHVVVSEMDRGVVRFQERRRPLWDNVHLEGAPLRVAVQDWALEARECGALRLVADVLDLNLEPVRPPTVHPPGYVGTDETGRLAYHSITRLRATGRIAGEPFEGLAWLDHQWGEAIPGSTLVWDWCGLHAEDGSDLMFFRVTRRDGTLVQVVGTRTTPAGETRAIEGLRMTRTQDWRSPSGHDYGVGWRVEAEGLLLEVEAIRPDLELLSKGTCVAYWEGPVRFEGHVNGVRVEGTGMGESVSGHLNPGASHPRRSLHAGGGGATMPRRSHAGP